MLAWHLSYLFILYFAFAMNQAQRWCVAGAWCAQTQQLVNTIQIPKVRGLLPQKVGCRNPTQESWFPHHLLHPLRQVAGSFSMPLQQHLRGASLRSGTAVGALLRAFFQKEPSETFRHLLRVCTSEVYSNVFQVIRTPASCHIGWLV